MATDIAFWQQRWEARQIAFHEGHPNALLERHIALLDGSKRVLVPLAGKSVDMLLLASKGLEVVGVEAVDIACREFFDDHSIPCVIEERGRFRAYVGGRVTLLCGDMFDVTRDLDARVGMFDAVYDRAALIALDPPTRTRYVDAIRALLEPSARTLLVTLAYDQSKISGPPWSVDERAVRELYRGFDVEVVEAHEVERHPKFVEAGVPAVTEALFRLSLSP